MLENLCEFKLVCRSILSGKLALDWDEEDEEWQGLDEVYDTP